MAATATTWTVLGSAQWQHAAQEHRVRADRLLAGVRERARGGRSHPVEDFLFSYYSLRPRQLRRWHPGAGVALLGPAARERLRWSGYTAISTVAGAGVGVDPAGVRARRGDAVRHVRDLLSSISARPAHLGCFGLHEWAMLYRQDGARRHAAWPLRLGAAGTDDVVESHRIRCSHYDAFRFFSPAARPRNALQPDRAQRLALEQPGCLHATMDLYKWGYKLGPAVPGELLLDCFELARDVRELDMRASPYDLSELGYAPVPIETADGKAAYVAAQRAFAARAVPLRRALLAVCDSVLAAPTR